MYINLSSYVFGFIFLCIRIYLPMYSNLSSYVFEFIFLMYILKSKI